MSSKHHEAQAMRTTYPRRFYHAFIHTKQEGEKALETQNKELAKKLEELENRFNKKLEKLKLLHEETEQEKSQLAKDLKENKGKVSNSISSPINMQYMNFFLLE